jgi:nucleoid-associated protein YgaU
MQSSAASWMVLEPRSAADGEVAGRLRRPPLSVAVIPEGARRTATSRSAPGRRTGGPGRSGRTARPIRPLRGAVGHDVPRLYRGARAVAPGSRAVRRAAPCASFPAGSRMRLTDRGRHVLAALALGAGLTLCALVGPVFGNGDPGLETAGQGSVVVESGDTLWSIAGALAGTGQDVRAVVDELREVNGLVSSELVPGQVLLLP